MQILVLIFFSEACFAIEDAIGDPTVPPSSVRSGLRRSPNPLDITSELAVTGNVSGLAYFHGLVPYRSTTEFSSPLGTSDMGSFLRRSAPISSSRSQYKPQPYYLPSSTVGSIARSGTGAVLTYPDIRDNKGTGEFVMPEVPKVEKKPDIPAASPLYDYDRTRPLSYESPIELERTMTYELMRERRKKELSEALQKATEGMYKVSAEEDQTTSALLIPQPNEPIKPLEPASPLQPGRIPQAPTPVGEDIYEQMLGEVAELARPRETAQPSEERPSEANMLEQPEEKGPSALKSSLAEVEKETSEAVVGIHKSFATEAKDKFNYYMRVAEEFLKQGKYYRAVDAYTLATVYKPDDPLAYAGRSHALFASGEYMSSAYFLARAINIFPQYIDFKIDLNAMIPDANRLESRIADVKQWTEKTRSAELAFLLAYICYQLDRTELALDAIKFSAEEMPDNAAVKALEQAIKKKSR